MDFSPDWWEMVESAQFQIVRFLQKSDYVDRFYLKLTKSESTAKFRFMQVALFYAGWWREGKLEERSDGQTYYNPNSRFS